MHDCNFLTSVDTTNNFVYVTFEKSSQVLCEFLDQGDGDSQKTCVIEYGPCYNISARYTRNSSILASDQVIINLVTPIEHGYCYNVTADNGSFIAIINGELSKIILIFINYSCMLIAISLN